MGNDDAEGTDYAVISRAVRYLTLEAGIRQFLDVGTGLPTVDNTHELAQPGGPESSPTPRARSQGQRHRGGRDCGRGRVASAQMVVRLMSVSSSSRRPGTS
jgi:S-adenosyl methyltransferase